MVHRITFATKHNYNKTTYIISKKSGSNSLQKLKVIKVLKTKVSKYHYNKKYSPWIRLKLVFCNKTQLFSKCRHQSQTFDLLAVKNSLLWTQLFCYVFTIIFTIFSNHSPRIGPRLCGWLSISEVSICSNFEPATYSIPSNMTQFSITRRRSTTCCSSQALTRNRAK